MLFRSVITKNWFIHQVKNNSKKLSREVSYEEVFIAQGLDHAYPQMIITRHEYLDSKLEEEFWFNLLSNVDKWILNTNKHNEKIVLKAIKIILESVDEIEIFNKKAIYLYIREITGLNTKQIANCLIKIKKRYGVFKKRWEQGKI